MHTQAENGRRTPIINPDGEVMGLGVMARFFASSRVLFGVLTSDGTVIEANEAFYTVLGYQAEDLTDLNSWNFADPTDVDRNRTVVEQSLLETGQAMATLSMRCADGSQRDIAWHLSWDNSAELCLAMGTDVTDERETDRQLRYADRFFTLADDYLVVCGFDGKVHRINDAVCRGFDITLERVADVPFPNHIHPDERDSAIEAVMGTKAGSRSTWTGRVVIGDITQWVEATLVHDVDENVVILVGRDVTNVRELTSALRKKAETDSLTGLANRTRLTTLINDALLAGTPAILFCDLDRFKVVNDSLGHLAGDTLLRLLGLRLEKFAKLTGTTIARLGGDEFVVLIPDTDRTEAVNLAHRFRTLVKDPFSINENRMFIDTCIGVAVCPAVGAMSAQDLLSAADTAVYSAKAQGQGRVVVFDDELQARAHRRLSVELEVRSAVDSDRLVPFLQPIVALEDRKIVGAEALVRMLQPDGSVQLPVHFLDVAEDAGLLPAIDRKMLKFALAEAPHRCPGLTVSVNVSAAQLVDPDYAESVRRQAQRYETDIGHVVFELTESSMLTDIETTTRNLQRLRELGARTALDDFGTGYSSLSHLRDFPIDIVKLERNFIAGFLDDRATRAVVEGVLSVCDALGMTVVAEGVETEEQAAALWESGCRRAQGWLFHKAMPVAQLSKLVTGAANEDRRIAVRQPQLPG